MGCCTSTPVTSWDPSNEKYKRFAPMHGTVPTVYYIDKDRKLKESHVVADRWDAPFSEPTDFEIETRSAAGISLPIGGIVFAVNQDHDLLFHHSNHWTPFAKDVKEVTACQLPNGLAKVWYLKRDKTVVAQQQTDMQALSWTEPEVIFRGAERIHAGSITNQLVHFFVLTTDRTVISNHVIGSGAWSGWNELPVRDIKRVFTAQYHLFFVTLDGRLLSMCKTSREHKAPWGALVELRTPERVKAGGAVHCTDGRIELLLADKDGHLMSYFQSDSIFDAPFEGLEVAPISVRAPPQPAPQPAPVPAPAPAPEAAPEPEPEPAPEPAGPWDRSSDEYKYKWLTAVPLESGPAMLFTTRSHKLYRSVYADGAWGAPQRLREDAKRVAAIAVHGGQLTFVVDTDRTLYRTRDLDTWERMREDVKDVAVVQLPNGRLQLWVVTKEKDLLTQVQTAAGLDAPWGEMEAVLSGVKRIHAERITDGLVSFCAITEDSKLLGNFQLGDAGWTMLVPFPVGEVRRVFSGPLHIFYVHKGGKISTQRKSAPVDTAPWEPRAELGGAIPVQAGELVQLPSGEMELLLVDKEGRLVVYAQPRAGLHVPFNGLEIIPLEQPPAPPAPVIPEYESEASTDSDTDTDTDSDSDANTEAPPSHRSSIKAPDTARSADSHKSHKSSKAPESARSAKSAVSVPPPQEPAESARSAVSEAPEAPAEVEIKRPKSPKSPKSARSARSARSHKAEESDSDSDSDSDSEAEIKRPKSVKSAKSAKSAKSVKSVKSVKSSARSADSDSESEAEPEAPKGVKRVAARGTRVYTVGRDGVLRVAEMQADATLGPAREVADEVKYVAAAQHPSGAEMALRVARNYAVQVTADAELEQWSFFGTATQAALCCTPAGARLWVLQNGALSTAAQEGPEADAPWEAATPLGIDGLRRIHAGTIVETLVHFYLVTEDGRVRANFSGEGLPFTDFADIEGLENVQRVFTGPYHACYVHKDGRVTYHRKTECLPGASWTDLAPLNVPVEVKDGAIATTPAGHLVLLLVDKKGRLSMHPQPLAEEPNPLAEFAM